MESSTQGGEIRRRGRVLLGVLLVLAALFYAMGFLHLRADFPNGSPWNDMAKMTDEGWYGGAAIHHFVQGSWYLPGSFNPAVAMPVWPAMLGAWFAVTGVSMIAARTLTMLLYGTSLVLLYRVVWRARPGDGAAVAVVLTAINPFNYAFNRLALLEPVTVLWMMLALWLAGETKREDGARQVLLGVVVFLLVLTKVTGVALAPAVLYLMWATWGWPGLRSMRWRGVAAFAVVAGTAAVLWVGYQRWVVQPTYRMDYELLFRINAYRAHLSIVPKMAWVALRDCGWVNPVLFPVALLVFLVSVVWLRALWRIPLFGAAAIAIAGHLTYVGYHTNFQPRYYEAIAMPLAAIIVLGISAMRDARSEKPLQFAGSALMGGVVAVSVVMMVHTLDYVLHPQYSFWEAAQGIAAIVQADGGTKPMLLSDSGDDITLWTGLPAICESYSTQGLDAVLGRYTPGWYAAWPGWEDKPIEQVGERYKMDAVARYRVFDDPERQTLVLYKLTPR